MWSNFVCRISLFNLREIIWYIELELTNLCGMILYILFKLYLV